MHRIDGANAAVALPAAGAVGATVGYFTNGVTVPATVVTGDWANAVQEEIVAVATMKGATLDKTNRGQMATALDAIKAIQSTSSEASGVDTIHRHAAIACDDAEIGESSGGVVHTLVAASNNSKAKGFESAVIASKTCRAGDTGGSSIAVAVIASENMAAEGNNGFVAASKCTDTDPAKTTGDHSAIIAASFTNSAAGVLGDESAIVAAIDSQVSGNSSAALADEGSVVSGSRALAAACNTNTDVSGNQAAALASASATVSGDQAAAVASNGMTVSGDGAAALASGLGFGGTVSGDNAAAVASDEPLLSGTRSSSLSSFDCEVAKADSAVIGSQRCTIPGGANTNIVMLASYGCDANTGQGGAGAAEFSVCGGWDNDITGHVPPSWRIDSNGGHIRGDGTVATGGMDYAEMFENGDQAAHAPGRILTRRGKRAHLAQPGERILGVVSAHPTIIGGDDLSWAGRYVRDEWGARVLEDGELVSREVDPAARAAHKAERERLAKILRAAKAEHKAALAAVKALGSEPPADGVAAADAPLPDYGRAFSAAAALSSARADLAALAAPVAREVRRPTRGPKRNPDYDPKRTHVPRAQRPDEYTCVGLLGQLRVAVDASVREGDDVVAGGAGVGSRWSFDSPGTGRGATIECMEIVMAFDEAKGYAVALCLVR